MKTFRKIFFFVVLIAFIGICAYYYVHEISSKLLVTKNAYTFSILELLLSIMGAFYMAALAILLVFYLIRQLYSYFRKRGF